MDTPAGPAQEPPVSREAVVDLLGVLAYGELTACIRMASDSDLAPTLSVKAAMAGLASREYRQYEQLVERMRGLGVDPEAAMQPFMAPFTAYHDRTRPKTWLEGLVKAYVGEGIAKDFYREMAALVDEETRGVMDLALEDVGEADYIVGVVRDATRTDPPTGARLALWGRRLVGEALSQAQAVAVDRDALAGLLLASGGGLAEVGEMFHRLTERHQARMRRLGLQG
ncbi:MAG TPA: ferritin-like fold-containing protein [Dermatophilaceae bacterium]|nr:ferritin-like fold-containing protein [Dermatophilaceae bacterium]